MATAEERLKQARGAEHRLSLMAADFVSLYKMVMREQLLTPECLTLERFKHCFDRMNIEYMHYAGADATQLYRRDVVEDLIQLAATYMTLPPDVAPQSRAFGIYLTFLLYSTQPDIEASPVRVRVSVGTLQAYLDDIETFPACQGRNVGTLGRHVTSGESQLLLTLHQARALEIAPFVNDSLYVRTLLNVHDQSGAPLLLPTDREVQSLPRVKAVPEDTASTARLKSYKEKIRCLLFPEPS
uniref:Small nuclear RNA activating protein 3 n=1 Tax=Trypanosoma congolense (strain IL3000) TaxID=1068625 RepID=G0UWR7_TRYCI|nr:conserved hypothetical protein [Trypanosoma congolense IL3000]